MAEDIYDFDIESLRGEQGKLAQYSGKVLLIVNTASKGGLTPQYEGLETLHKRYNEQGFEVLGFPCNQFGKQEPGSSQEITDFCQANYGVSFPMHAKIEVNGSAAHPLYKFIRSEKPGILGTTRIKWNFTKFLVNKQGKVVDRFGPNITPAKIAGAIERELAR